MFWPDIAFQQRFYRSRVGKLACRRVRSLIRARWDDVKPDAIMAGVGHSIPYLQHWVDHTQVVGAFMPGPMGVCHWPKSGTNQTVMCDAELLPLPEQSIDFLLLIHVLEHTQHPDLLMEEASRILKPGGRLLIIAPNRSGLWSNDEDTPFGYGTPYSRKQLITLTEQAKLSVIDSDYMLYCPPTNRKLPIRYTRFIETIGKAFLPICGGLVWMDAQKQLFAPVKAKRSRTPAFAGRTVALGNNRVRS